MFRFSQLCPLENDESTAKCVAGSSSRNGFPLTDEAEGRRQSANAAEKYDHVGQGKDVRIEVM